jgi:hypothetical protein
MFPETGATVLAVVPPDFNDQLLKRAGDVADMLGADLHCYCPVTRMLAPHSDVTPENLTMPVERIRDRERGRQIAGSAQYRLNLHNIDGTVEAGACPTMTDGILSEAARLKPDLLMLPFIRSDNILPVPERIRYETVWSKLPIPVLIVGSDRSDGRNVAGYVATEKRRTGQRNEGSRVCAAVTRLADRLGSEAHLLSCQKPPAALAVAKEALAPPEKSTAEVKDDTLVRALHDLAAVHAIPPERIHIQRRPVSNVLDDLVDSLQLGLIVTDAHSRSLIDRLANRWPAAELLDQRCDVLTIGKPGAGMDVA